ncbi:uncharacterized protein [Macrobrachium rosenbergii]|uniref:uncharacterized protein isoform X2 n=1 Tax=Macrobrachium rosenbergii TaxID=79674 RepID=UPI0034D41AFB
MLSPQGRVHQTLRLLCLSPSPPTSKSPSPPTSRSLRPSISRIPSYPNLFWYKLTPINQQESQLSQSLLVQVDSYQSDDEVIHQPLQTFNYDSSVDDIDLPTPSSSHSVPGTSRSSSSSSRNNETCGRTPTPKRKRNMTPEHAPSATEVALSFLKTTAQAQRKEDIPYAAGVFVKEVISEFPRHNIQNLCLNLLHS